jgi:ketosteroid isomerase-like protein
MSQENVEVVRRLLTAAGRQDIEAALDCLDSEVEWIPLRAATEGSYRGHEGFTRFVADTNESFEVFEPQFELRDLGDQVLAWGKIRVRSTGRGVELDVPAGGLFDLRDGKITRWHDFGSPQKALEAARLSE